MSDEGTCEKVRVPVYCRALCRTKSGRMLEVGLTAALTMIYCGIIASTFFDSFFDLDETAYRAVLAVPLKACLLMACLGTVFLAPYAIWARKEIVIDSATKAIEVKDVQTGESFDIPLETIRDAAYCTLFSKTKSLVLRVPEGKIIFWIDNDLAAFPAEFLDQLSGTGWASENSPNESLACDSGIVPLKRFSIWESRMAGLRCFNVYLMVIVTIIPFLAHQQLKPPFPFLPGFVLLVMLAANVIYALFPRMQGAQILGFTGRGWGKWVLRFLAVSGFVAMVVALFQVILLK